MDEQWTPKRSTTIWELIVRVFWRYLPNGQQMLLNLGGGARPSCWHDFTESCSLWGWCKHGTHVSGLSLKMLRTFPQFCWSWAGLKIGELLERSCSGRRSPKYAWSCWLGQILRLTQLNPIQKSEASYSPCYQLWNFAWKEASYHHVHLRFHPHLAIHVWKFHFANFARQS